MPRVTSRECHLIHAEVRLASSLSFERRQHPSRGPARCPEPQKIRVTGNSISPKEKCEDIDTTAWSPSGPTHFMRYSDTPTVVRSGAVGSCIKYI